MKIMISLFILLIVISFSIVYPVMAEVPRFTYKIVNTYPHDKNAFTQGLIYKNGYLYEGTGLTGHSSIRKVNLETGQIIKIYKIPENLFGEGITVFQNKIYQLTWKSKTAFVYDLDFNLINKFHYSSEGWGLTHDESHLIMSDGTENLYFVNPDNFQRERKLKVTLNNKLIKNINELEYIDGMIYANIWMKDQIVKINPDSGKVTAIIDLKGIINSNNYDHKLNVLNGIAFNKENSKTLVTGKLWPVIFEIELIPVE